MSVIDDKKAREARDVGIQSVVEQQRMGGLIPSQRDAEEFVATILPRALQDAQDGLDAAAGKQKVAVEAERPKLDVGKYENLSGHQASCEVDLSTGQCSDVRISRALQRDQMRQMMSGDPWWMAFRQRFKLLLSMPEWRERIQRSGWDWEKIRKIVDDSNGVASLGRWDACLRGPERKIFSGAGGRK